MSYFVVVDANGDASLRRFLTDPEIAVLVAADSTVVEVRTTVATSPISVYSVDEGGTREELREAQ